MNETQRFLVSVGLGFIGYRVTVEFMQMPSAVAIGLILAGCVWALTRQSRKPPKSGDGPGGR